MAAMKYGKSAEPMAVRIDGDELVVDDPRSEWDKLTEEKVRTRLNIEGTLSPEHIMSGMDTVVPADMVHTMRVVTVTKTTYRRKEKK